MIMIRHRLVVNRGNRKIFGEFGIQETKVPTNVQWVEFGGCCSVGLSVSVTLSGFGEFFAESSEFALDPATESPIFAV